jgi:hypothetical protein
MATTYTWTVDAMSVLQTPQPDFVVRVQWTCAGVDGGTTAELSGTQGFDDVEGDTFTPYANLTEAEVLAWVWEAMGDNGKENIEASVNGMIQSEINPPVAPTGEPLPW